MLSKLHWNEFLISTDSTQINQVKSQLVQFNHKSCWGWLNSDSFYFAVIIFCFFVFIIVVCLFICSFWKNLDVNECSEQKYILVQVLLCYFFILDWKSISKATNHLPEQEKSCWESLQNKRTKICKICGSRIQDSKRGMFREIYAETLNVIKVLCLFNQPRIHASRYCKDIIKHLATYLVFPFPELVVSYPWMSLINRFMDFCRFCARTSGKVLPDDYSKLIEKINFCVFCWFCQNPY